jgi:endonuclease IV
MIGFHVSKNNRSISDSLKNDIKLITDYGMKPCAQIFVTGPRDKHETLTISDKNFIAGFTKTCPVVIHGAYVDIPWKNNPENIINVKTEMNIASEIKAKGVVLHLHAGANDDTRLKEVFSALDNLSPGVKKSTTLFLEINTAKKSNNTFETPEKINKLFERIDDLGSDINVGLCVDTAHVYSCGVALDEYNTTMDWLNAIEVPDIMFHLNDSASTLNSGVDKHAPLTKGNIWKHYGEHNELDIKDSGIMAVLDYATVNSSMVILEREEKSIPSDLKIIYDMGHFRT